MLTYDRLVDLLEYDPDRGVFSRRVSRGPALKGSVAGSLDAKGYVVIEIDGKAHKAHRLAIFYVTGAMPGPAEVVDHIDLDKANNRMRNLRTATKAQNCANRAAHRNNALGVKGVHRLPSGSYRAKFQGKSIGVFPTVEAAASAYQRAASLVTGNFARAS